MNARIEQIKPYANQDPSAEHRINRYVVIHQRCVVVVQKMANEVQSKNDRSNMICEAM